MQAHSWVIPKLLAAKESDTRKPVTDTFGGCNGSVIITGGLLNLCNSIRILQCIGTKEAFFQIRHVRETSL